tara:strand:- start:98 stop:220 length:123 start_codon:yes stop_codon:yes gene_type:complete
MALLVRTMLIYGSIFGDLMCMLHIVRVLTIKKGTARKLSL